MSPSAPSPQARETLRHLTSSQALDFCARLLSRSKNGILTFREFYATAVELIREQPQDTAVFLAALVALDMGAPDVSPEDVAPRHSAPCHN